MPARARSDRWGADDPVARLGLVLARLRPNQVDAFCQTLSVDELDVVERALALRRAVGWRGDPLAMAVHLSLGEIRRWRYVQILAAKFREAVEGISTRQLWMMPARMGKTEWASVRGPVWAFDRDASMKIILASYALGLAIENAGKCRDMLIEHGDELNVRLRADRRARGRWNTEDGGGLLAAGVGSTMVGFGADLMVLDDVFKNWQEAHSELQRNRVWDWYRAVVRLRLEEDDSAIIHVGHRLHEDDLAGKLLAAQYEGDGEEWDVVRIPAIAEAPRDNTSDPLDRIEDILGRSPGEIIEPERFSETTVRTKARTLGAYLAAALEQQRPAPEEGGELKRAWWVWDDRMPDKWDDALTSWDPKLKDRESGDYVVGQAWVRTGTSYWCIDQIRGRYNQATTRVAIALMQVRHPKIGRHVVENTGNGPEVMDQLKKPAPDYVLDRQIIDLLAITEDEIEPVTKLLRRGMNGLIPEKVKGTKVARARAVSPILEGRQCHLPTNKDWAISLVNESAAFPNGTHDDQVDAWSQAIGRLSRGTTMRVKRPKGNVSAPKTAGVVTPGTARTRGPLRRRQ